MRVREVRVREDVGGEEGEERERKIKEGERN